MSGRWSGYHAPAMDREDLAIHLRRARRMSATAPARDAGDRTMPAAREWLRRWAPRQLAVPPPACTCIAGRCSTCN